MTDEELLLHFESKLGKSPILDELMARMLGQRERTEDLEEELEVRNDLLEALDEAGFKVAKLGANGWEVLCEEDLSSYLDTIAVVPKQPAVLQCKCPVCEAPAAVSITVRGDALPD